MLTVIRPLPDARLWQLVQYELADDGKTECYTYERTVDGKTEERSDTRPVIEDHAQVLARRSKDEMVFDALFEYAVRAYN